MTAIISNGISDTQLYLQSAANVKAPFAITNSSGQYPAVGNVLVNRRLANQWQMLFLDQKIFVDGLGVTSMNATEDGAVAVRIPKLLPAPRNMRTLSVNMGGKILRGTEGNDQPFNNNLPHGMQTDAVDVFFTQLYDEAAQVSRSQMRMIGNNLDLLGQYTSNIPTVVSLLEDATIMATQVGTALAHANTVGNRNIVFFDSTNTNRGYMQNVMNNLATKLSNVENGYIDGVISYPIDKSVFVLKYSTFNKLMTIDNGAIINSDIGQKILLNGKFSADNSKYLGGAIRGEYGGIMIKVVPDELWITVAALLRIPASQLAAWNKIGGYICNAAGTYHGRASVLTEVDKAPTTSMGFLVRNDWQWGTQVARPTSIALLVDTANNGADFANPVTTFDGVVSPRDLEATIQSYYNAVPASGTIQAVGVSPSTLVTNVTLTVNTTSSTVTEGTTSSTSTPITDATLIVVDENGARVSFGNNGDGTYNFTLDRASTATVTITAPGYVTSTLNVSESDTALATKNLTKTLTASA